jgi:hypothetical protein
MMGKAKNGGEKISQRQAKEARNKKMFIITNGYI